MAGVVACFWQAFPNLTNTQIMQRIRESADRYDNPDAQYGYGIPDFEAAYSAVLNLDREHFMGVVTVFPNPVTDSFTLTINTNDIHELSIQVFNSIGKKVYQERSLKSKTIDVSHLNSGIYILKIKSETQQKTIKLIKQ